MRHTPYRFCQPRCWYWYCYTHIVTHACQHARTQAHTEYNSCFFALASGLGIAATMAGMAEVAVVAPRFPPPPPQPARWAVSATNAAALLRRWAAAGAAAAPPTVVNAPGGTSQTVAPVLPMAPPDQPPALDAADQDAVCVSGATPPATVALPPLEVATAALVRLSTAPPPSVAVGGCGVRAAAGSALTRHRDLRGAAASATSDVDVTPMAVAGVKRRRGAPSATTPGTSGTRAAHAPCAAAAKRKSAVCEHGRERYHCKECGGGGICEHGRQRNGCKECGGAGICEHGRERYRCKECGGSGICEHGRQRYDCKECVGVCAHGRVTTRCRDCRPAAATSVA